MLIRKMAHDCRKTTQDYSHLRTTHGWATRDCSSRGAKWDRPRRDSSPGQRTSSKSSERRLTIAGGQLAIATTRTTQGWWGPACPGDRKILGPDETLEGQPVTDSTWERSALHIYASGPEGQSGAPQKLHFFLLVGLLATNEKRWSFCGAPLWPSGWEGYAEPLSGAAWYWLALPWSSPSLQVRVVASAATGLTFTIWLATRLLKVFLLQMHRLQRTIQLPSSRHKSQCV